MIKTASWHPAVCLWTEEPTNSKHKSKRGHNQTHSGAVATWEQQDLLRRKKQSVTLTKERQKRLKGKVHDAPARLLPRLQHDLLLTHLAQIKPCERRRLKPALLVHFSATCVHMCDDSRVRLCR